MADKNLRIRTLLSIIALPGVVLVVIPAIILWLTGSFNLGWGLQRWLADQFGEDYQVYKQNVPRWIPRLTPWQSEQVDAKGG